MLDNNVEDFFGEDTALSRVAHYGVTLGGTKLYEINDLTWRMTRVEPKPNGLEYCAWLQYYTWMRLSSHLHRNCFSIVVHDALFVPEITELGVGADQKKGLGREQFRLFSTLRTPGVAVHIEGLAWRNGTLTLMLSPYDPLDGLALEVIDWDYLAFVGKGVPDNAPIILTLFPSEATTDKEAGTLTWAVENQPWEVGDSLTFRIRAQRLPPAPP